MKSAADAAALAGAVYLPNDESRAFTAALRRSREERLRRRRRGNATVTPRRDLRTTRASSSSTSAARSRPTSPGSSAGRAAPASSSVDVGVTGAAEFVLPVPMGSPENYYGVFGMTRGLTDEPDGHHDTQMSGAGAAAPAIPTGRHWRRACEARPHGVRQPERIGARPPEPMGASPDDCRTTVTTSGDARPSISGPQTGSSRQRRTNDAQTDIPTRPRETLTIAGLQVRLTDAFIDSALQLGAQHQGRALLGRRRDHTWTTALHVLSRPGSLPDEHDQRRLHPRQPTAPRLTRPSRPIRPAAHSGRATTSRRQLPNPPDRHRGLHRLREHVQRGHGRRACQVDRLSRRPLRPRRPRPAVPDPAAAWGPGRRCDNRRTADCFEADGEALNPRGFWATLNTQGAENVERRRPPDRLRHAHRTRSAPRCPRGPPGTPATTASTTTTTPSRCRPVRPAAPCTSTTRSSAVWPLSTGTGDRWFGGGAAVGTFYEVLRHRRQPRTTRALATIPVSPTRTGASAIIDATDSTMGGSTGGAECRYRSDTQYGDGRTTTTAGTCSTAA